jgi:hypothetical protein
MNDNAISDLHEQIHLEMDLYFMFLYISGELKHFNGVWIGTTIEYKQALLKMIDLAHNFDNP